MMKQRALVTLAACLLFATPAWAQSGGYGMGPGMMGGHGMGPGMMGGYGMGHGMMDGYGMGPGMMGGWGPNIPDLTSEQRSKISAIQKELRQKQWTLMEKMHDDAQQGNIYRGGKFDEQAARRAFDARASLHKQMFENSLEAQKRIDSVLTPQQREQLQRAWGGGQ